ncbi:hypothetical protein DY000_02018492 [Brassica cretica]|uniref:Uncharacterized protein n=1 Tax=Brassica cretica TaxID=69181 RepID=A0ABQ7CSR5_BRACR|nr:hypothetical protein DY000_02018492 [Brassica cretica]
MDPFSEPCSFQNLLNSQQPQTSFSFASREPSIEVSAPDASVFAQSSTSVPCSLGGDEPMARPVGVKAAKGKGQEDKKEVGSM